MCLMITAALSYLGFPPFSHTADLLQPTKQCPAVAFPLLFVVSQSAKDLKLMSASNAALSALLENITLIQCFLI